MFVIASYLGITDFTLIRLTILYSNILVPKILVNLMINKVLFKNIKEKDLTSNPNTQISLN